MSWLQHWALRYGLAVVAVLFAYVFRLTLVACVGSELPPYITFYPGVMAVALLTGLGPGVLATALSGVIVDYWILPPVGDWSILSATDIAGLVLFVGMGLLMSVVAHLYKRDREKAATYERKLALRESEERLRSLGDNLPDSAIYQYARSDGGPGRFTYLSAGIERLNGIRIEDALQDPGVLHRQILPEYLDRLMQEEVRCIHAMADFDMDVPMRRTDGQVRWMRLRSRPRKLPDGAIVWDGVQTDITAQHEAELQLQKQAQLLELSTEAIFAWEFEGIIEYWNSGAEILYGFSRREALGKVSHALLATVHPQSRAVFLSELKDKGRLRCELTHRTKDGRRVVVESNQELIRTGGRLLVLETNRDITERKAARDALRESEEQFRVLIQNLVSAVALVNERGEISIVNKSFLRLFDLAEDADILNVNSRDWSQWQVFDEAGRLLDVDDHPVRKAAQTRMAVRDMLVAVQCPGCTDRKWMLVSAEPILDAEGKLHRLICTYHNITERKRAEHELRKSEERFRLLSETSAHLLAAEDPLKVINDLARKVMEHLECHAFFNFIAKEDGSGLHLNAYAGIPPEAAKLIEHLDYGVAVCGCVASSHQRIIVCDIFNTADPRTELVRGYGIQAYCCHPLMGAGNQLIGTLSFGTRSKPSFTAEEIELMRTVADQVAIATQRIRAKSVLENAVMERTADLNAANRTLEARAIQLRSLASSLTLAERRERDRIARVLHDNLQQQLAVAKMHASNLKPQQMTPGDIAVGVSRIETLVGGAIEASRSLAVELSPPVLHRGGLGEGFKWLAAWMLEKYRFQVVVDLHEFPSPTNDIKILLFESAREILFNSFKHSGTKTAHLVLDGDGGQVRVTITDSGKGFDVSPLDQPGSGFGLFSISERLSLIEGNLEVDSAPGNGSRFVLTAPATNIVRLVESEATPSASVSAPKLRIVLADDHAVLRESLALVLKQEPDIEIVGEAQDGEQAIELARKLSPDVILLDINMPKVNGIEAAAAIHRENPAIRIVGLTMLFTEGDSAQRLREAGAVGLISKNDSPQDLICTVRDLCCPIDSSRSSDIEP